MTMMKTMKMIISLLLLVVLAACDRPSPVEIPPSYPFDNPEQITIDSLKQDTVWSFTKKRLYYPELGDSIDYIQCFRKDNSLDCWYFVMYNGDTLHKYYYCRAYNFSWKNHNYGSIQ